MKNLPKHVALIMDGNRRWAKSRGLLSLKGHQAGEDRIEPIIDYAIKLGIPYLTFWAFSTENWNRNKKEVQFLLKIFRDNLNKKVDDYHKKNVRLSIIGNLPDFPQDIQKRAKEWMEKTKNNSKITVNLALSYGGRDEIIRAINKLLAMSNVKCQMSNVTKVEFAKYLDTAGQPDPDLIIRTAGELRLSGFLMWQSEYSELYFTDKYWPDFTPVEFEKAIVEYQARQRRFGR